MEPTGITVNSKMVRLFQAFHIKEEQGNLVIGISLEKHLVKDQTIPCDIGLPFDRIRKFSKKKSHSAEKTQRGDLLVSPAVLLEA